MLNPHEREGDREGEEEREQIAQQWALYSIF